MRHIIISILMMLPLVGFSQVAEVFGGRFTVTASVTPIPGSEKFQVSGIFKHPRANYTSSSIQVNDIFVDCDCNVFTVDSIYLTTGDVAVLRVNPQDTSVNKIRSCTGGILRANSPPNGTFTFPANIPLEIIDCFLNYNFQALSGLDTLYFSNDTLYAVTPTDTFVVYLPTPYLNTLPDVDTTGIIIDDLLQWNGSAWIMSSPAEVISTIYNADDTITSNRTVEIGANTLAFVSNNAASDAIQFYQVNGSNWNNSSIGYQRLYWDIGDIDSEAYQTIYTTQIRNKVQTPDGYVDYRINDTTADYRLHNVSSDLYALFSPTGFSLSPTTYTTPTAMLDIAGDIRVRSLPSDVAPTGVVTADANGNFTSSTPAQVVSAGGAPTGSGVANRVTYWSGASTLTSDAGFTHTNGVLTIRPSSLNANDPQIVAIAQTSSYAYLDIKASSPGWDSQVRWYTNDPGTLNWSLGSDGGSTNDLVLRNEFRNKDFIRLGNASTPTVTFDLHNPGKYRFLSGSFGIGVTPSYTLDVTTGGLRLGAEGSDITGVAGVLEYYGWFKGHDGSAWNFLPKADAASWTSGYIPFSNGSRLTASSGLYFDSGGGELRLGGTTDRGGYDLQLNSQGIYINGAFPAIKINTGGIEFGSTQYTSLIFGTTSVASPLINLENTSTASANAMGMKIISARPSLIGSGGSGGSSYTALLISTRKNGADPGGDFNNIAETVRITTESSLDEDPTSGYGMKVGGGLAMDWNYKTNSATDYRWKAGRIVPIVVNSDANNLEDTELAFYASVNKVLTKIAALDSAGIKLPLYASAGLTGTPQVMATSTNSEGRLINRKFAYAEMYIDDTDTDTISITSGVPAKGSDWTAGELANFTYSAGRLTYTGTETAKFLVNTSISFSFGASAQTVEGWIYKTGAEVTKSEFHKKIVTATEVGQAGQTCIIELSTNDYIELFFDATSSSDLIVQNANVNLIKI